MSWKATLNLESHPEGGAFREVFRSPHLVEHPSGNGTRPALTHIYFHLAKGECSRFHRVASDEIWNLYQGEGLTLHLWKEGENQVKTLQLGAKYSRFCAVIPAGTWQAAEIEGEEALVGCSVGPGFDFSDFRLIDKKDPEAHQILSMDSDLSRLL